MKRLFSFGNDRLSTSSGRGVENRSRQRPLSLESLESRQLMHAGSCDAPALAPASSELAALVATTPTTSRPSAGSGFDASALASIGNLPLANPGFPTNREIDQQMGLPFLDSLPGAPATLYLDFDGNFLSSWSDGNTNYPNVSTPVFDTDGNPNSYSASEQALIKNIWSRVAEDYAPFNINVSTDYYGSFDNGKALRVAVGGNNTDWAHQNISGTSYIGSFHNEQPNVVFAFDMVAWAKAGVIDGDGKPLDGPAAMATTISHEAAHSFGLRHHSVYDANGTRVNDYNPGTSTWTPIMGENKAGDRTTWANMASDQGTSAIQDDMAVIAAANNGFGYRADDHGNTKGRADRLTAGNVEAYISPLTGRGVIGTANDVDAFKFTTSGGLTQIKVEAAPNGPNLIPVVELRTSKKLLAHGTSSTPTQSIIEINLKPGTYYVIVKGAGDYGDVGQYTVKVTKILLLDPGLAATGPTGAATTSTTVLDVSPTGGHPTTPPSALHLQLAALATADLKHVPLSTVKLPATSLRSSAGAPRLSSALQPALVDQLFANHQ